MIQESSGQQQQERSKWLDYPSCWWYVSYSMILSDLCCCFSGSIIDNEDKRQEEETSDLPLLTCYVETRGLLLPPVTVVFEWRISNEATQPTQTNMRWDWRRICDWFSCRIMKKWYSENKSLLSMCFWFGISWRSLSSSFPAVFICSCFSQESNRDPNRGNTLQFSVLYFIPSSILPIAFLSPRGLI